MPGDVRVCSGDRGGVGSRTAGPRAARASVHPCSGPSARDGTAQPQGRRLPSSLASRHAALPGWRRPPPGLRLGTALPAQRWGGSGQASPSSPSAVVAATPNSASCGCGRWRAVRQGERAVGAAARHPRLAAPRACCRAGACAALPSLPGHGATQRARPSPAAADPGPPLHQPRLGAAPPDKLEGRWRLRTAPLRAQHREKAGQGPVRTLRGLGLAGSNSRTLEGGLVGRGGGGSRAEGPEGDAQWKG